MRAKERNVHNMNNGFHRAVVWCVFGVICVYTLLLFLPYVWEFINAFKIENEFAVSALALPKTWHFDNIIKCFSELQVQGVNFLGMVYNSIKLVILMTVPGIVFPVMLAYIVAKYPCKFTKTISVINLIRLTVPVLGSWPAMYSLIKTLDIINNPATIWILWSSGSGAIFFTLVAFFNGISNTYMEAAKIDGAGNYLIFFRIILPQATGIITAFIISAAIGAWNDYETSFLYFYDYPTVGLGLYKFKELQTHRANRPMLFMGISLFMLPVLILFVSFSKVFMKNVSIGGIKA